MNSLNLKLYMYQLLSLKTKCALFLLVTLLCYFPVNGQLKLYYNQNKTLTYQEGINFCTQLCKQYSIAKLLTYGKTDVGKPLHLLVIDVSKKFDPIKTRKANKRILLIMNAIHPGEPDGVDASLQLAYDLVTQAELKKLLQHTVVCIIPFYNVDGILNRSRYSRSNQNGPEECGFRGNAHNLDLNRDFIKADAANTYAFYEIFHQWQPDLFIDTHTTNGADFQYVLTFITSQTDKMTPVLGNYTRDHLLVFLYQSLKNKGSEAIPYVNTWKYTPEEGIVDFMDSPRYSTGFANLFNTIGFVVETNKFKPFPLRVKQTYDFLLSIIEWINQDYKNLGIVRKKAIEAVKQQAQFPLNWVLDTTQFQNIEYKGYKNYIKDSKLTGAPMTYYDTNQKFTTQIRYFNHYKPQDAITKPRYYVLPQAYPQVLERLKANKIAMLPLSKDTLIQVKVYYVNSYQTTPSPYEGHYLHSNTQIHSEFQTIQYYKGDYLIPTDQAANRFIVETLEPQAPDSYFNWNFFDAILMQKEWFTDYQFEKIALQMLNEDPALKQKFEAKKNEDQEFARSSFQQLYYLFLRSPYYEKSHNRYPIGRIE